jgi:hypothetical protein
MNGLDRENDSTVTLPHWPDISRFPTAVCGRRLRGPPTYKGAG